MPEPVPAQPPFSHRLKKRLLRLRDRLAYRLALSPDGGAVGFLNAKSLHVHLSRAYLGEEKPLVWQRGPRLPDTAFTLRRLARRHGLAVSVPSELSRAALADTLLVPRFICLSIDLPPAWDDYVNRLGSSARDDLRRVRSQGFEAIVSNDASLGLDFYERFQLPTVLARHGDEALRFDFETVSGDLSAPGAELIRIFHRDRWVAGVIGRLQPDGYRLLHLGWLQADPDLLRSGVISAVYHAGLRRAYELGQNKLILGGTLPYLEDGVFAYKAKWGARIDYAGNSSGDFAWLVDPSHPHFRRFLQTRTLLACTSSGRVVAFSSGMPRTDRTYAPALASLSSWYRLLDAPDSARSIRAADIPVHLRAWFTEEPLPHSR